MKVRNSLKSLRGRHRNNRLVRRKGRLYVINKTRLAAALTGAAALALAAPAQAEWVASWTAAPHAPLGNVPGSNGSKAVP